MACAESLAAHPDRFEVTLIEAQNYCGGQAFSIPIDEKKYGAPWLNQGVQGGSHIYHHTFHWFKANGHEATPVELQVSFGKGDTFWTNRPSLQLSSTLTAQSSRPSCCRSTPRRSSDSSGR